MSSSSASSFTPVKQDIIDEKRQQIIDQCKREKWNTLYPAYFDKTKSIDQGRKVLKELAVAKPTAYGVYNACLKLGHNSVLQVFFCKNFLVFCNEFCCLYRLEIKSHRINLMKEELKCSFLDLENPRRNLK